MEAVYWLFANNPSVEDAKAFIKNHPDALMGIEDREGDICVPLHYAIRNRLSDEVILLLLEACPQAAAAKEDFIQDESYGFLPLHYAIGVYDGHKACSEKVFKALLNANPGAASARNPSTKNLPLHDAVKKNASEGTILSLLNAYPQAAAEKMKDGRLLFEIYLERKASDDLMRAICKVRFDGLLPLGVVLTKRSSDDVVLAVLKADPEAAGKRFSTKCDECILPLHIAYEDEHSEPVKDALSHAYPDAEMNNPFETNHQLHKLLENESLDPGGDDVEHLIETYPEAAGKRGRDGRLPLHIAIDRIAPPEIVGRVFGAYPQAGKEKMKDGRLPIDVIAEQKVTEVSTLGLTAMATILLKNDMPVSIEDGTTVEHSGSWHACISYSTETATSAVRSVLLDSKKRDTIGFLGGGFGKHIHALADARDAKGRTSLGLASEGPLELIYEYLLFCGRYKLRIGPPEHRTATSVVLRAQDLAEQADYGVIFDKADNDGNGKLDRKELKEIASSIGLDPDLFLKGSKESDESISKGDFVSICKQHLGDGPRKVVIKLMKNKDQWERECNARKKYELNPKYVVSALPNVPPDTEIADAVRNGEGGLDIIKKKYLNGIEVGEHAFVMEAGDRNLLQMFFQEQPKLDDVRVILRKVFKAVEHLHKEKLMHGDIKMLNIVRFRIDNGLRLIDLDASAKIVPPGGEEDSFAGVKFSSAILPPEMIERIEPGDVEAFNKYWVGEDDDLVKKVAPKPYKEQGIVKAHYVVKSFRTVLDGKPVYDGLPYTLVEAKESIDLWSLGVLAFTLLTGEPLIPSTRDDDCASGAAMHLIKSWGTQPEVLDEVFNKIEDEAGRDLVWKLLQYEPAKRESMATLLEKHCFFNPPSEDLLDKLDKLTDIDANLKELAKNCEDDRALLKRIDINIEVIKKLGIESKAELRRTRHVLLKGIFEATEVDTPTTFIVLNDKLPEPPNEEMKKKILGIVTAEDGSGVSVTTEHASVTLSADGANIDLEGDLKERFEVGITWAKRMKEIGSRVAAGEVGKAFDIIKEEIEDLIVGETMYLYLVDELTGKPVEAKGWPLPITTPADIVPKLLPLMQVGIRAMCIYNGTAGLAALFGFPLPRVPKAWSQGAQESVELLKQESSVQEFGVVHKEVEGGTEEKTSVRGASLRDFQDFLKEKDPGLSGGKRGDFAGLKRIGDPEDGAALWTALTDQSDIENALKERAKQHEEEQLKQDEQIKKMAVEEVRKLEEGASGLIEATASAAANGHNQKTAKKEKESEGFGKGDISDKDGRLPVGTTASSNERSRSMANASVVTADEINVSNDSRNLVVDSEEMSKLIKAAVTAAAEEATAAATTAAKEAAAAVAKEAVSAAASSEKDCLNTIERLKRLTYSSRNIASAGNLGAPIASILFTFAKTDNALFLISGYTSFAAAIFTFLTIPDLTTLDLYEIDKQWRMILNGSEYEYDGAAVDPRHLSYWERRKRMNRGVVITRHVLLKGIFEATEVKTPSTFIILNNKLPPAAEPSDEKVEKVLGVVAAEDGSGVSVKTKHASLTVSAEGLDIDLEGNLKTGLKWAERIIKIGTNFAAGDIDKAFETIKDGIDDLIVGKTIYLYLVDELTGEPVRAEGWPLPITTPSKTVPRLIPLMQVGMRVMTICNGAAGLAKVFNIPAPQVPKEWSKGARDSVELLKQESSVQEYGIVHAQVKGGTEEEKSVRGASLRQFQNFMTKNDPGLKEGKRGHYADMQRIVDPEEGTAVWTALTNQSAIESALKDRANERKEEEKKQDLNRRQEETAELKVVTQEETIEETSGMEEVHSSTGEFAKRNDTRNVLAASDEMGELIKAAKEATAAAAAAKDSEEIAELIRLAATAAAKEVASAPAAGSVCCTIM